MRYRSKELGIDIEIIGQPTVLENLFEHEEAMGHEILFLAEIRFLPSKYDHVPKITFHEDNGQVCTARWFDLNVLDNGDSGLKLFPAGLKEILQPTKG